MAEREVPFINVTLVPKEKATLTESQQRITRSHAARSAHARVRHRRMTEYQAQKRGRRDTRDSVFSIYPSFRDSVSPGVVTILSADRRDPFHCFARGLNSLEHFLFDHYVSVVIPLMRCNESAIFFAQRMIRLWVPTAITESSLLDIILLAACRHLSIAYGQGSQEQQRIFQQLTLQYKSQSLHALRHAISAEMPLLSDSTVAKAIMLAYDELYVRDTKMLKHHVDAAVEMVTLKGGPQTLGLDGLMEHFLFNLITKTRGDLELQIRTPW
ncbi:hypothetical protein BO79DRAFT_169836 [Aspergillus costaricaensis CBS 115574]|uniref:Uncharacterized protein n=1 Tax=Aspergillus costaricaensis CBS 115574 TaxID=1448317 RepID=A0ACD1IJM3_9EURO|nr:hypothetical protein BO79DRAFT_169836 [Aspergillus costaricaensis CBS 115574]RAK90810.1 hypothetical protein BO79DRAFT_169836 [Aspergillus costaricaensis CBS 115574]